MTKKKYTYMKLLDESEGKYQAIEYELLNCPFCGKETVPFEYHTKYGILCTDSDCPASNPRLYNLWEKAIQKWNTRN